VIDRAINSVIDSASPIISKWRIIFCALTMIFLSPEFSELYYPPFYELSIKELSVKVVDVMVSISTWLAVLVLVCTLYVIPAILFYFLRRLSSMNIRLAEPLIDELISLRKKTREEMEDLIAGYFDEWKERSLRAQLKIERRKELCEVSILAVFFYITVSLNLGVFNWLISILLVSVFLAVMLWVGYTVLLIYLRDVSPYKILEEYVKYFVLVKERFSDN